MEPLVLVFALAFLAEALTEYFVAPWLDRIDALWAVEALKYSAVLVGVALAINYGTDLFALFGFEPRLPYSGEILTGILLGRGSNWLNDFVTKFLQNK